MSLIKRLFCVLLCLLVAAVLFPVKASSFNINLDGKIEAVSEWKGVSPLTIFPSHSETNCDIDFACMRMIVDEKNNAVFLGLQVRQKMLAPLDPANTTLGIKLFIKNGVTIICRNSPNDEFDSTAYSVNKAFAVGRNSGELHNDFILEMRIGYLHGVPDHPLAGLQLIDSSGQYSNYYSLPVVAPTTTTTTKPVTTKTTTTAETLYKIKFDSNGGKGGKTQSLPYGASPIPPTVSRDGYSFSAWSPAIKTVTDAAIYKAQWSKNTTGSSTTCQTTSKPTASSTNNHQTSGVTTKVGVHTTHTTTSLPSKNETNKNKAPTRNDSMSSKNNTDTPNNTPQSRVDAGFDLSEKDDAGIIDNSDAISGTGAVDDANTTGETGIISSTDTISSTGSKKQIAAVAAAIILLSLAIYFLVIASKQKAQPKAEPEGIAQEMDEKNPDDDF